MKVIYFMEAPPRSFTAVKIGFSKSYDGAWERLRSCLTGSPDDLSFLHIIEGDRSLERELHDRFDSLRLDRGCEWFRYGPALRKELSQLMRTTPSMNELGSQAAKQRSIVTPEEEERRMQEEANAMADVIYAAYEKSIRENK